MLPAMKRYLALLITITCIPTACDDPPNTAPQDQEPSSDTPVDTTPWVEDREACADRDPLKKVFFGDMHIHTSLSFDAYIFDVRVTPEEAHAFAKGEPVQLPPLDENGVGTTTLQLDRPLDFVALTDHSEYLAEVQGCSTPDSPVYDTGVCADYRAGSDVAVFAFGFPLTAVRPRRLGICTGAFDCKELARAPWLRIQEAAEAAYDRSSACSFTSFVAYEWSGAPNVSNQHRNILFRSEVVPELPTTFFEYRKPLDLWNNLQTECLDGLNGCDFISIPHNSNWSNGNMFVVEYPGAETEEEEREAARFRARMEPIIEIYQHKGDSECINGLPSVLANTDEFCDFEKLPKNVDFEDCGDGVGQGAMAGAGCTSKRDFIRGILKTGLQEQERIGVNPYKLGITASTDTHNGTPGATEEDNFAGHWGNNEDIPARRLERGSLTPGGVYNSAGGLTAVWAEENSRGALFDGMRQRETYGTSGTRIIARFFGGWDYPQDLCDSASLVQTGYDQGVPMGGDLPEPPNASTAPVFAVNALMDAGSANKPGTPLQRIQIIKGWLEADGTLREQVYDVAGDPNNGASVDTATCETSGTGFESLCTVWTDPDFDPAQHAFYYARVLENPTCRWSTYDCNTFPVDQRPETCSDPSIPKTVQERAWTSPIWYTPTP